MKWQQIWSFVEVAGEEKEAKEEDFKQNELLTRKDVVALHTGAKEWFRRNHSKDPEEAKIKDDDDFGWTMVHGVWKLKEAKKAKPKVSHKEMIETQLKFMHKAGEVINDLLFFPVFGARPQGLLFELSRCHFMKGDKDRSSPCLPSN